MHHEHHFVSGSEATHPSKCLLILEVIMWNSRGKTLATKHMYTMQGTYAKHLVETESLATQQIFFHVTIWMNFDITTFYKIKKTEQLSEQAARLNKYCGE